MDIARIGYGAESGWSELPPLDSESTLVLVFGAPEYGAREDVWNDLRRAYPKSLVCGCSSAGEIAGAEIRDRSISGAVARFERTAIRSVSALVTPGSASGASHEAGRALAWDLTRGGGPDRLRVVLVISDGLSVNGTDLIRGLNSGLPQGVLVTGGLAGDGDRFEKTWVVEGGRPVSNRVVAVGLFGEAIQASHGCKGGWDKFGPERRVTRSDGPVLYELDGQPALALYKRYLGDRASGLPATGLLFPLAIRPQDESGNVEPGKVLVRTILRVDEAAQSLTFAGDIPTGSYAQLMKANFDRLVQGAADAAEMAFGTGQPGAVDAAGDLATLAIAISCVGRRLVLGERTEEELEATLQMLPARTQQIGFYSYGEISPHNKSGSCELHNQTMTLTLLRES